MGVPLGPLLFLLYFNDLDDNLKYTQIVKYADVEESHSRLLKLNSITTWMKYRNGAMTTSLFLI